MMDVTHVEPAIRTGEWLTIIAALIGPVLAIQAQKFVEARQAKRAAKEHIFRAMMATRAERLSPQHVQALNMIDLAFYGTLIFRMRWQSKNDKAVCRAWRDYFESLTVDNSGFSQEQNARLFESRDEKFNFLLSTMAVAMNYDIDPADLKRNRYSPVKHGQIEEEAEAIRTGLAELLNAKRALPLFVVNLHQDQQQAAETTSSPPDQHKSAG